ncbi:MAG: hypothetical protein ACK53I_17235 [Phenylobacterium sp.]|jgi:hypothetical protein
MRLLIAMALAALAGTALAAPDPAMKALMAAEVNPGALAFWAGGNDPPEGETPAAAEARWIAAEAGARTLQAAGRAMAEPGVSRPGRWNEFAALMVSTGAEGEAASRARNAEQAFEIGGRLYDACNGCHKTYVPTPQRLP